MRQNVPSHREAEILGVLVNGETYGRAIRDEYERRTRRRMPLGSLYVTLDRMEHAGLVRSRVGESAADRGGNRRKYYRLTANGCAALNDVRAWATSVLGALRDV